MSAQTSARSSRGVCEGRSDRFSGEVIGGRAQPTRGDQHPGSTGNLPHLRDQTIPVVSHNGLPEVRKAQSRQLFSKPASIAIHDVSEQKLRADAENLHTGTAGTVSHGDRRSRIAPCREGILCRRS